jgi:hypothetical protein
VETRPARISFEKKLPKVSLPQNSAPRNDTTPAKVAIWETLLVIENSPNTRGANIPLDADARSIAYFIGTELPLPKTNLPPNFRDTHTDSSPSKRGGECSGRAPPSSPNPKRIGVVFASLPERNISRATPHRRFNPNSSAPELR